MNFKKKIATYALIAGLSLGCVSQAKANSWQALAGVATGVRAGIMIPIVVTNPVILACPQLLYAFDTLLMSFAISFAADILSIASGSDRAQVVQPNDFNAGFCTGLPLGVLAFMLAYAENAAVR